jgi:hypothetical protein
VGRNPCFSSSHFRGYLMELTMEAWCASLSRKEIPKTFIIVRMISPKRVGIWTDPPCRRVFRDS